MNDSEKRLIVDPLAVKGQYKSEILAEILRANPDINVSRLSSPVPNRGQIGQFELVFAVLINQIADLRYELETRTKREKA